MCHIFFDTLLFGRDLFSNQTRNSQKKKSVIKLNGQYLKKYMHAGEDFFYIFL